MSRESPLGKASHYGSPYDPGLLFAIARSDSRQPVALAGNLPFSGTDIWTAWDLSWLHASGVPQIAAAEFRVPCDSPRLIESKSLKLYLNSLAMSRFASADEVRAMITSDLGACVGAAIEVQLFVSDQTLSPTPLAGHCIDHSDVHCDVFDVDAQQLSTKGAVVRETLHSHLLRSLCPVTNQPDIGSLLVSYHGPQIDRTSLLRYIVSYREHKDFHEACVERMFVDIQSRCQPTQLSVYARYQRRGGIDINPFRSNFEPAPSNSRTWRQ